MVLNSKLYTCDKYICSSVMSEQFIYFCSFSFSGGSEKKKKKKRRRGGGE
jgi:hypothetical protein